MQGDLTTMGNEARRRTEESCVPPFPYLSDVGIITLVPCEWESTWLSRHQTLTRLAKYFHVVWCTPARWWRQREWWLRGGQDGRGASGVTVSPGLTIYQPERWLPGVGRPRCLARWTERQRLRRAHSILRSRECRKTILYLWRPNSASALDLIDHDLSCYYINDEYTFSDIEQPIDPHEARLISRVDQVFIHSTALLEKKGQLNPQTTFIPNGVDYCAFATPCSEPADLQSIPHPRIGYVGRIKQQLNLALLTELAQRHQGWSFVLVGPQEGLGDHAVLLQRLAQMPNVYLLGGKSVQCAPGLYATPGCLYAVLRGKRLHEIHLSVKAARIPGQRSPYSGFAHPQLAGLCPHHHASRNNRRMVAGHTRLLGSRCMLG